MEKAGPVLYDKINLRCRECGYKNVTDLCAQTGVSRSILSELHSGRSESLSMHTISKLAPALDVAIGFFEIGKSGREQNCLQNEDDMSDYIELLKRRTELQKLLKTLQGVGKERIEAVTAMCQALA